MAPVQSKLVPNPNFLEKVISTLKLNKKVI